MESEGYLKIDLISTKKVTNPDTKQELLLEDLWKTLEKEQLLYIVFFRKWE